MKRVILPICIVFCIALVALSSSVTTRVLVETESLKVLGAETFPKDLACEVYIGSKPFPCFRTSGGQGQLDTAAIEIDLDSVVSVLRKDAEQDSYVLFFFSEDKDGKTFGLFDLNCDGQWDVKKTPTRGGKQFVFFGNEWLEVDKVDGLRSRKPTATKGKKEFEFHQGTWKLVRGA